MNYFAHGVRFLDDAYFLAGTALPDWLNVVDRRVRVRANRAAQLVDDSDPRVASLARGIVQHHHDDAWFHETATFHDLSLRLTLLCRDRLAADDGFRPSFLGHILVELLLDSALINRQPELLERYYRQIAEVDGNLVQRVVNRTALRPTTALAAMIPLFCRERFLSDYGDDAKLCVRLNQIMRRVGLPILPENFSDLLPQARMLVTSRHGELLRWSPAARAAWENGS